jgi:Transposase C of IS166 homeodomain
MVYREVFDAAMRSRNAEIMQLGFQLAELRRLVHGARSERFKPAVDPQQPALDLGEAMEAAREETRKEKVSYERDKPAAPKAPPARMPLPAHLPREVVVLEPEGDTEGLVCNGALPQRRLNRDRQQPHREPHPARRPRMPKLPLRGLTRRRQTPCHGRLLLRNLRAQRHRPPSNGSTRYSSACRTKPSTGSKNSSPCKKTGPSYTGLSGWIRQGCKHLTSVV